MFCEQLVECRKVAGFLVVHVLHEWLKVRMCFHDRGRLRSIDEGGSQLSCLIDTERSVEVFSLLLRKWCDCFTALAALGAYRGKSRDMLEKGISWSAPCTRRSSGGSREALGGSEGLHDVSFNTV